jgi:hypothetical protein
MEKKFKINDLIVSIGSKQTEKGICIDGGTLICQNANSKICVETPIACALQHTQRYCLPCSITYVCFTCTNPSPILHCPNNTHYYCIYYNNSKPLCPEGSFCGITCGGGSETNTINEGGTPVQAEFLAAKKTEFTQYLEEITILQKQVESQLKPQTIEDIDELERKLKGVFDELQRQKNELKKG